MGNPTQAIEFSFFNKFVEWDSTHGVKSTIEVERYKLG
jgi:hypothetical protein